MGYLVVRELKVLCKARTLKQPKYWLKRTLDLAVFWGPGAGERKDGPFVAGGMRASYVTLGTNLHYFNPPWSTKRWVGLKYDEHGKDVY
jgi:hypothetical protein